MLTESFWSKVDKSGDCWVWLGSIVGGYGHYRVGAKVKKAHRLMFEDTYGEIPSGLFVMHSCDNRRCCNPKHLRLGTARDNNKDRDQKGRHVALRGEKHGMAVLNDNKLRKIRALQHRHTKDKRKLADQLGVSVTTINDVMDGRTWKLNGREDIPNES